MAPTESARSALSSFTCTLCNKSYSRHPEYEAHISSYDHQHRKRLQDLKQLSRDPNAAEKARRAEKKADVEAGLRVIGTDDGSASSSTGIGVGTGGFKKGGFKSSFAAVKGPTVQAAPAKKNVLEDDEEEEEQRRAVGDSKTRTMSTRGAGENREADSDSSDGEYAETVSGEYYDPRMPTGCTGGCTGLNTVPAT